MGKNELIQLTSDSSAFAAFSAAHLLALVAIALLTAMAALLAGRVSPQARKIGAILLALFYGGVELYWIVTSLDSCERMRDCLPLHLCDFSVIFACVALLTRRQFPFEFIYFFGLAGTFQALITPDLPFTFPSESYFRFFIGHGGVVVAVGYLIAGFGLRPTWASVRRMVILEYVYIVAIGAFNWLADTNYGYVCRKPAHGSLLDILGPWPVYVVLASLIALANILLLYLPYYWLDRRHVRNVNASGHLPLSS